MFVSIPWYISYHQTSRGDYRCHSIMTENMIPRKMGEPETMQDSAASVTVPKAI